MSVDLPRRRRRQGERDTRPKTLSSLPQPTARWQSYVFRWPRSMLTPAFEMTQVSASVTQQKTGHEATVQILLATDRVDPSARDNRERTLLWFTVQGGSIAIIQMLLATGKVEFDCEDNDGRTPLLLAAAEGVKEAVEGLLRLNHEGLVDPHLKDTYGRTPQSMAIRKGYTRIARRLFAVEGIDPVLIDSMQNTPLVLGARNGHVEVVELFLSTRRVRIDLRDRNGFTPLMLAK